jgi:hypothetical protein
MGEWQKAYELGYKQAGSDWKHAVAYAKEQERLRLEDNFKCTEEIIELEYKIEELKDYKFMYEELCK